MCVKYRKSENERRERKRERDRERDRRMIHGGSAAGVQE